MVMRTDANAMGGGLILAGAYFLFCSLVNLVVTGIKEVESNKENERNGNDKEGRTGKNHIVRNHKASRWHHRVITSHGDNVMSK